MPAVAHVERFLSRLQGVHPATGGYEAKCPAHDDSRASLSVTVGEDGRILVCCHKGCDADAITGALGLKLADLFPPREAPRPTSRLRDTAVYEYTDEEGRLLFQVVRQEGLNADGLKIKSFPQRRPARPDDDPLKVKAGWVYTTKDVRRPLYRLPAVLKQAAAGRRIYLVEGEKDVDTLERLGVVATTHPGGADDKPAQKKWLPEHAQALRGAKVVILPDNDRPGRYLAQARAGTLAGVAAEVKVVELPDVPEKGDVTDWIGLGGTIEALRDLVAAAPEWSPREEAPPPEKPTNGRMVGGQHDSANADRFLQDHQDNLRWHPGLGWLVWDGARWRRDEYEETLRRCEQTMLKLEEAAYACTDRFERQDLLKFARSALSARSMEAAVRIARRRDGIGVLTDELDARPMLFNCMNGTVDLETGVFREADRKDLLTKRGGVVYDASATAPTWERFLSEAMPDESDRAFLQRFTGYAMTGVTREQVFVVMWGEGRNGKGTWVEMVGRKILGDYGTPIPLSLIIEQRGPDPHPTDKMVLRGARFGWASEPKKGRPLDLSAVKLLTGNDTIVAHLMHQDNVTFHPTHKLALLTNGKPPLNELGVAVKERIRLVPWTEQFTVEKGNQDTGLSGKLERELPGILNWCIAGCLRWQKHGLGTSENIDSATKGYFQDQDLVQQFLEEECVRKSFAKINVGALQRAYQKWCEEYGHHAMNGRAFKETLHEKGLRQDRSSSERYWIGLGLRASGDDRRDGPAERKDWQS